MTNNEIIGLWTLPLPEVIRAFERSGMELPDWWRYATKISARADNGNITFIGRRPTKGSNEKQI